MIGEGIVEELTEDLESRPTPDYEEFGDETRNQMNSVLNISKGEEAKEINQDEINFDDDTPVIDFANSYNEAT